MANPSAGGTPAARVDVPPNAFGAPSKTVRRLHPTVPEKQTLDDLTEEPHAAVFADAPRTVRLALDAGESVAEHDHPGEDVLFVLLDGRLDLELDDETCELRGGDAVRFAGERRVRPEAVADSTALVVFAPRLE